MNKLILPALFGFCLSLLPGEGQSGNTIPPPAPPFIAPIPDNTIWTIKVVTGAASPGKTVPGTRVADKLVGTKSGDLREVVSTWTDGSQSETWYSNHFRLEKTPGSDEIQITALPPNGAAGSEDFIGLGWLSLATYTGIETINGHDCYHFHTEIEYKEQRLKVPYTVYIDVKTRQPVTWDVGPVHFEMVSTQSRNPNDPLVLPPAFAERLKAHLLAASEAIPYKKK
jgi:hypothetical protein